MCHMLQVFIFIILNFIFLQSGEAICERVFYQWPHASGQHMYLEGTHYEHDHYLDRRTVWTIYEISKLLWIQNVKFDVNWGHHYFHVLSILCASQFGGVRPEAKWGVSYRVGSTLFRWGGITLLHCAVLILHSVHLQLLVTICNTTDSPPSHNRDAKRAAQDFILN